MRTINLIVIHCSATRADRDFTEDDLEVCHRRRGFNGTGYHFYIRKNGDIKTTREIERIGAHAKGHNQNSIGICYEGGLDCHGHPADTRTEWQIHSMRVLILALLRDYPGCRVCGHRDLSPDLNENGEIEPEEWIKACPCFEVKEFCSKMYSIERLVTEYINTCHKSFLVLSFLRLFSGEFYLDTGQMFDKESSLYILNNDSAVFLHENIWLRLSPYSTCCW